MKKQNMWIRSIVFDQLDSDGNVYTKGSVDISYFEELKKDCYILDYRETDEAIEVLKEVFIGMDKATPGEEETSQSVNVYEGKDLETILKDAIGHGVMIGSYQASNLPERYAPESVDSWIKNYLIKLKSD